MAEKSEYPEAPLGNKIENQPNFGKSSLSKKLDAAASLASSPVIPSTQTSAPALDMSLYSSQQSTMTKQSRDSFKSYRTDDSEASCLFVTQLNRALLKGIGRKKTFSEYSRHSEDI